MLNDAASQLNSVSQLEHVELLQNLLVARATGNGAEADNATYQAIRQSIRSDQSLYQAMPAFVRNCRSLGQFWEYIKSEFSSYAERRAFLWDEFRPVIETLEGGDRNPAIESIQESLQHLNAAAVQSAWGKALSRREEDPEGAITAARSLLETVCKHILDDCNVLYRDTEDLPQLWRLVAQQLNLAPEQHQEETFKTILGSCSQIASRLANMRNTVGDAHGTGRRQAKPKPRHAELAVNLAGTMSAFLVSTWQEKAQHKDSL